MAVPLRVKKQALENVLETGAEVVHGAIVFYRGDGLRQFGAADLLLAQSLADRAASKLGL